MAQNGLWLSNETLNMKEKHFLTMRITLSILFLSIYLAVGLANAAGNVETVEYADGKCKGIAYRFSVLPNHLPEKSISGEIQSSKIILEIQNTSSLSLTFLGWENIEPVIRTSTGKELRRIDQGTDSALPATEWDVRTTPPNTERFFILAARLSAVKGKRQLTIYDEFLFPYTYAVDGIGSVEVSFKYLGGRPEAILGIPVVPNDLYPIVFQTPFVRLRL